jgi:hypothetical protein
VRSDEGTTGRRVGDRRETYTLTVSNPRWLGETREAVKLPETGAASGKGGGARFESVDRAQGGTLEW